jgi:hypothetical protein
LFEATIVIVLLVGALTILPASYWSLKGLGDLSDLTDDRRSEILKTRWRRFAYYMIDYYQFALMIALVCVAVSLMFYALYLVFWAATAWWWFIPVLLAAACGLYVLRKVLRAKSP